jgi:hypothetical protein
MYVNVHVYMCVYIHIHIDNITRTQNCHVVINTISLFSIGCTCLLRVFVCVHSVCIVYIYIYIYIYIHTHTYIKIHTHTEKRHTHIYITRTCSTLQQFNITKRMSTLNFDYFNQKYQAKPCILLLHTHINFRATKTLFFFTRPADQGLRLCTFCRCIAAGIEAHVKSVTNT